MEPNKSENQKMTKEERETKWQIKENKTEKLEQNHQRWKSLERCAAEDQNP